MSRALALVLALAAAACDGEVDAGGSRIDAGNQDDPLAVSEEVEAGSLDQLHREVVARRCSGQPGLCHNGQFEPNLSTPTLFYEYTVGRPALEKADRMRVVPGDPEASLLVDKLRNREVSTQMPLGAEPLAEEEIALIEAWIEGGALRRLGAEPPPALNNPPRAPEIAVFDAAGERLDSAGPFSVAPGSALTLRHSVSDFETSDDEIAFSAFLLQTADGRQAVLAPDSDDPAVGPSEPDPDAPMGSGDLLNRRFALAVASNIDLVDQAGEIETVASSGLAFTILAVYVDEPEGGIAALTISPFTMEVE